MTSPPRLTHAELDILLRLVVAPIPLTVGSLTDGSPSDVDHLCHMGLVHRDRGVMVLAVAGQAHLDALLDLSSGPLLMCIRSSCGG